LKARRQSSPPRPMPSYHQSSCPLSYARLKADLDLALALALALLFTHRGLSSGRNDTYTGKTGNETSRPRHPHHTLANGKGKERSRVGRSAQEKVGLGFHLDLSCGRNELGSSPTTSTSYYDP
jgi:hypothetical protein